MAHYFDNIVDVDMGSGWVHRSFVNRVLCEGDEMANRFGARMFRNGEPVNADGASCFGYFIRSDRTTVVIDGGTFSGNTVYVTLPESCYAVDGCFSLVIKLVGDNYTTALVVIDGTVIDSVIGGIIDPGSTVPDLDELMAVIERAEDAADRIADMSIYAEYMAEETYAVVVSTT